MKTQFAYWIPNITGRTIFSKIIQHPNYNFDSNTQLAQTSEEVGFDYALSQISSIDSYSANSQLENLATTVGLIRKTERLKAIASVIPGLCHPGIVAKVAATIDFATNGRFCLNVMNGCLKDEFIEQRYLRCQEFINVLKGMWTEDEFHFQGNFYQIHSSRKKPQFIKRSHPEIFLGGNSKAARSLAARVSDWYFLNGNTVEGVRQQIAEVSVLTRQQGRKVKFGLNAFVIVRDTEAEAHAVLEEMIAQADVNSVKYVGISKRNHRRRISANSDLSCLTQYHDGFKTGLIGTVEQVAEKIRQYNEVGVEMILCSFLNYTDDLPAFGRTVIPLVREIETRNHLTQELFVA